MKRATRLISYLIIFTIVLGAFSSCKQKVENEIVGDTSKLPWGTSLSTYKDSSKIPSWNGKKLSLNYWVIDGLGGISNYLAGKNDIVRKEIARVTGITIDENKSFDNSGNAFTTKYADVTSGKSWPSLIVGSENLEKLVKVNKLYDLSKLIPTYCPNVLKIMKPEWKTNFWDKLNGGMEGKTYAIPLMLDETNISSIYSNIDKTRFKLPYATYDYFWVRDDILKELYPNTKTQAEIEKQYVSKGTFTMDEILDFSISSKEEFTDFLKKVKALNKTEDGRKVYPVSAFDGVDNWGLYSMIFPALEGLASGQSQFFFSFDNSSKKLVNQVKSTEFKNDLKYVWNWLQEDLAPKECLVEKRSNYEEKFNRGLYAITTSSYWQPNNTALKKNKGFQYRRVYITTPYKSNTVSFSSPPSFMSAVSIMKNKVQEKDVPQVLRFIDFMFTEAGQKLMGWGSKASGKFAEDVNGNRTFSDKALEDQMVNNSGTDLIINYGLGFNKIYDSSDIMTSTGWLPTAIRSNRGIYGPYYAYSQRKASEYYLAFNPDVIKSKTTPKTAFVCTPWVFSNNDKTPKFKAVWDKRTLFFDALLKVLAAKDSNQFETNYSLAMKKADEIGLTSNEVLKEVNDYYKELNKDTSLFN